jgi:hypothetical protein
LEQENHTIEYEYDIDIWHVVARLQHVDETKRMVHILANAGQPGGIITSKHTVVFDHKPHLDEDTELAGVIHRVVSASH